MYVCKRFVQILENVSFAGDATRTLFVANIHWNLLLQNRRPQLVIYSRHVLHLLGKSSHSLELATRRCEVKLILGHCLRRGNEFMLHIRDGMVEHLRNRPMLLLRFASLSATRRGQP